jgi:flagellar hook protein FlgE
MAIDGSGFFIAEDDGGSQYFTRAGAMHIDGNGYLVDINNYKIQGYAPGSATLGDVNTSGAQSAPDTSTIFSVGLNLDARTSTGQTFYSSQTVYDSLGAAHTLAMTYEKTEGSGYWGVQASIDGTNATAQNYTGFKFDGSGNLDKVYNAAAAVVTQTAGATTLTVNNRGQMYKDSTADLSFTYTALSHSWVLNNNGGYTGLSWQGDASSITIDLDGNGGTDITLTPGTAWADGNVTFSIAQNEVDPANITVTVPPSVLQNGATISAGNTLTWDITSIDAQTITGYASASAVKALYNDGYPSGVLKSLAVEGDGTITGYFTNGQTTSLGQIALADFANPWGLKKMGQNLFSETLTSGQAIINNPGSGGLGELKSNSLEMSNTDIGTEFINMITAQRAYQASAKIITTTDDMMTALMNTKR